MRTGFSEVMKATDRLSDQVAGGFGALRADFEEREILAAMGRSLHLLLLLLILLAVFWLVYKKETHSSRRLSPYNILLCLWMIIPFLKTLVVGATSLYLPLRSIHFIIQYCGGVNNIRFTYLLNEMYPYAYVLGCYCLIYVLFYFVYYSYKISKLIAKQMSSDKKDYESKKDSEKSSSTFVESSRVQALQQLFPSIPLYVSVFTSSLLCLPLFL
jgi:cbb3-type cytochrome oxidase subunit 3